MAAGRIAMMGRRLANDAVACLALGIAIHLVLWQISEPKDLFSDLYKAYFSAAEILLRDGPRATWEMEESSAVGFVNMPILAWIFIPLVPLGEVNAGWVFLAVGAAAVTAAWALLTRLGRPEAHPGPILLLIFFVNGPLINSLREGNSTHLVLFLLVAALILWRNGWEFSAGLLLGLGALFKLPLLLYGVYFALRGRWRIVAGGTTMVCLASLLSFAIFGLEINIGWYKCCVEPFLGEVMPAFNVQSIDGFLLRLSTGETQLFTWDPMPPPMAQKIARMIIFGALGAGAIGLIVRGNRCEPLRRETGRLSERDLLGYCGVLVLAILTSPVSWTHYFLLLLVPWGLYVGGRLPLPEDATTRWLMGGSLVLTSLPVIVPALQGDWWGWLASRTVISAWLFGGLLMLASLTRGMWHLSQPTAPKLTAVPAAL